MVDDYFAEGWPGVSEGVHAFMLHQRGIHVEEMESPAEKLVPFFIGFNKVLLAAEDFASSYQDALLSRQHLIGLVTSNHKTPHRSPHQAIQHLIGRFCPTIPPPCRAPLMCICSGYRVAAGPG